MEAVPKLNNGKKVLGVEFAPLDRPFQRRLQMFGVIAWLFLLSTVTSGTIACLILFALNPIIGLLYIAWMYYDRETPNRGGRRIESLRSLKIWNYYRDYFPLKLIKTADLDPKKNYLFGAHPHGIFCNGPAGAFGTDALEFKTLFPKMTPHLLTIGTLYYLPFTREICMTFGALPATKPSMTHILTYPDGGKVGVLLPGGVPEMLESRPGTDLLKLKNRKGFIKLALQTGAPLVPVYTFGETDIYDQLRNPEGSLLRRFQLFVIRFTGYYIPLVNGRGIFQYTIGLIPRRIPITTVVGAPIESERTSNPTQEQIDGLHDRFLSSLKQLFYSHRASCGFPNAELEII